MESLPSDGYLVHVQRSAFIPIAVISGIGIIMTSLFIVVNIKYRGYKLLKMTSPNLNLVMLCGSILLCVAVVLFGAAAWLPEAPSKGLVNIIWQINHAGIWLASVAFTLFFAPLAAKTWRVHRIFSDAAVKGRVIKDDRLLCFVALLVIFDLGYLALWFGIDPPKCRVVSTSRLPGFFAGVSPALNENDDASRTSDFTSMTSLEYGFTCASKFTPLWVVLISLYKGALLYYIIYVAWSTRYVTLPSMKDAGGLIISVFVTLSSFCVATPLVASLQRWPNAQYILMSCAIFLPLFTVLLLHFVPKLILIRRHSKHEVLTKSFSQYTTPRQPEYSDDEIRDLAIQNATLRKEVAEKQRRYKTILEQLRVTKAKLFELSMLTSESTEMNTCTSDDALRSAYTESTADISSDAKGGKRKESLAKELAQKVTRALILKSQGSLKPDEVSITMTSSSASQQIEDEIEPVKAEEVKSSQKVTEKEQKKNTAVEQKDPDVSLRECVRPESEMTKRGRHVSFNSVPQHKHSGDLSEPSIAPAPLYSNKQGPVMPKPVFPVLGRNSWDYYTRGTGYLRYKATVLNQGTNGTLAAITGYPVTEPRRSNPADIRHPVKPGPFQSTPKLAETPGKGVELKTLNENTKKTKTGEFKYFSTSASSRSPSSSTDMTSSLGRSNDETAASNNNVHPNKPSSVKSGEAASSNNETDVPSANSAFSVVSKGKRPRSGHADVKVTSQVGFHRIGDVGIAYEDYSTGSDSDEYDNTTTSMDSITCELFPPLTPRHKHYLRRYDAMQAKYLASREKYHKRYKKTHLSEKSDAYSSGNDVTGDVTIRNSDDTRETPASGKSGQSSFSRSYLNRDSKRKLLARARRLDDAYLYDSITSSDSDSDSDWGNSAALQQCWERVAQMGQLPLIKAGPITFSHTRKDGIFV